MQGHLKTAPRAGSSLRKWRFPTRPWQDAALAWRTIRAALGGGMRAMFSTRFPRIATAVELFQQVGNRASEHDVDIVAAGLSFYALLGLFPSMLALVSLYGLVADPASIESVVGSLTATLPVQARTLVQEGLTAFVARTSSDLTFSVAVGIIGVLWSSSSGMGALVHAINVASDNPQHRSFFGRRVIALSFTLAGVIGVAFVVPALTALPRLAHLLRADTLLVVLPSLVLTAIAFLAMLVLFRYAPHKQTLRMRDVMPGAAAASLSWLVMSTAYSLYVRYLSRMSSTYGALEGVIVLELWFYFSALVLLYAVELNIELVRRRAAPR
jgi:membrane protein